LFLHLLLLSGCGQKTPLTPENPTGPTPDPNPSSEPSPTPEPTLPPAAELALIKNYQITNIPGKSIVRFRIEYDQIPDFFSTDSVGRSADAFQIFVRNDGVQTGSSWDVIVRSQEIARTGYLLVRDASPHGTGGEGSGGWGPIRYPEIVFNLQGKILSFEISYSVLNETDGRFYYQLSSFWYGSIKQNFTGKTQ